MTTSRSVLHDTMVLERTYAAAPERVFAAWADPQAKRTWMLGDDDGFVNDVYELDFRIDGVEHIVGKVGDAVFTYDAHYDDIVENTRIVYSNYMLKDDVKMSVSVTSVEFAAEGDGTKLVLTEHGIYLDGIDRPEDRMAGISVQLDALGRFLT